MTSYQIVEQYLRECVSTASRTSEPNLIDSVNDLILSVELQSRLKQLLQLEDFDNINRMAPVRISTLKTPTPKKKDKPSNDWDVISVPTKAELDYQQNGLTLPQKVENLEKLLSDYEKTGRFDYELCYLLRKQEAQEDLKKWIGKVIQKRRVGDDEFGKESDAMRFNDLIESTEQKVKGKQLFRDAFVGSLQ